jgi:hypothetical protein
MPLLLYILLIGAVCEALWSANRRSTGPMNYISTDGLQCVTSTEGLQALLSGFFCALEPMIIHTRYRSFDHLMSAEPLSP